MLSSITINIYFNIQFVPNLASRNLLQASIYVLLTETHSCSLEGKLMTYLDSVLKKQRHHFANKVLYSIVKAMVFPVVMYACQSWTIKKAECQRIDAFGLWCWRRLLRAPWTARRSEQSIPKEINPKYSLEGLMLKLQYFGHLMGRADSIKKTLMLEKKKGMVR